tara:strand:- start:1631 stop:2722 length:1092 start_codon:yes stop_codon:yes gene_type:complete
MAFNFGAFLGGGARGGTRTIERFAQQNRDDEVTKEAQQWQIATEARAASRARKTARAAKQKDAETLLASLSFHFGDENAAKFVGKGTGFAKEALKQADLYVAAGVDPATQVKIGQITGEDLPNVTSASAATAPQGLTTGSITFKPIPQKVKAEKNSWEDKLSSHYEAKISIPLNDVDALAEWDRQKTILKQGHAEWKAAATKDSDGDPSGQLGVDQARGLKMLRDTATDVYKSFGRVKTDLGTMTEKIIIGNEVEELEVNSAIVSIQKNEFVTNPIEDFVPDKFMEQRILAAEEEFTKRSDAYVKKIANGNGPENITMHPIEAQSVVEGKIEQGIYKVGDVIQWTDKDTGQPQQGIIGTRGVF